MKYWRLEWTPYTNYYVQIDLEIPILDSNYWKDEKLKDHSIVSLKYHPVNCLILGKPGEPSIGGDLDMFMFGVDCIYPFMANLGRSELREHPGKFTAEEVVEWIIDNYPNPRLVEQLKLSRPYFATENG